MIVIRHLNKIEQEKQRCTKNLVSEAFEAMKSAYAPYSNYHVGACVLC